MLSRIVKLVKKPTGKPHPVWDVACSVKLGREVGRRWCRTNSVDQFLGMGGWCTKGNTNTSIFFCLPYFAYWGVKDIFNWSITLYGLGLRRVSNKREKVGQAGTREATWNWSPNLMLLNSPPSIWFS